MQKKINEETEPTRNLQGLIQNTLKTSLQCLYQGSGTEVTFGSIFT